jgi:hypothetical protein
VKIFGDLRVHSQQEFTLKIESLCQYGESVKEEAEALKKVISLSGISPTRYSFIFDSQIIGIGSAIIFCPNLQKFMGIVIV